MAEKFFGLTCPCGATLQIDPANLKRIDSLHCPNCNDDAPVDLLHAAMEAKDAKERAAKSFDIAMGKVTSDSKWKFTM